MKKKFKNVGVLACLMMLFLFVSQLYAPWVYNPFTRKLDYYSINIGGALTGEAAGDVLFHDGTNWTNLTAGANGLVLTLVGGLPTWVGGGAPGAHAASHELLGADLVDHDNLTNFVAAEHLLVGAIDHDSLLNYVAGDHIGLPSTIAVVLTDHNLAAHTALGLFDASADVDHDLTTNYVANQHINWTAATDELDITRATAPLIDLNPAYVGTGATIDITPSAQLTTVGADWDGIDIQGAALDPSVGSVEIHGININLNGVSTAQDPSIDALNLSLPADITDERIHSIRANRGFYLGVDIGDSVAGLSNTTVDVVYDTTGATGGKVHALDVARAGGGTVNTTAIGTHTGIDVIHQHIGAVVNFDQVWEYDNDGPGWTDITAECANPAVDVAIWDDVDDEIYVGQATTFDEIPCVWNTAATANMFLDFYYSAGGAAWTAFDPSDDTFGATVTGNIRFLATDLAGWAVDTVNGTANKYWIRIERTRVPFVGPTEDTIRYIAGVSYEWDEDAQLTIKELIVNMTVAADQMVITQAAVAGIATQPLIDIDDDRTGVTADTVGEATIVMNAAGTYALYVQTGDVQFDGDVQFVDIHHTAFISTVYYNNGNSGAAITIDWNNGNLQYVTLDNVGVDVTFTEPPNPGECELWIIQDGTGDRTIDWEHEVSPKWPGDVEPTLSTGGGDIDVVVFTFIGGTTYRGLFNGNFE